MDFNDRPDENIAIVPDGVTWSQRAWQSLFWALEQNPRHWISWHWSIRQTIRDLPISISFDRPFVISLAVSSLASLKNHRIASLRFALLIMLLLSYNDVTSAMIDSELARGMQTHGESWDAHFPRAARACEFFREYFDESCKG
jgi:hypothetical protein